LKARVEKEKSQWRRKIIYFILRLTKD
jgi:hypothetical protein